jgi:hypothetical protein
MALYSHFIPDVLLIVILGGGEAGGGCTTGGLEGGLFNNVRISEAD